MYKEAVPVKFTRLEIFRDVELFVRSLWWQYSGICHSKQWHQRKKALGDICAHALFVFVSHTHIWKILCYQFRICLRIIFMKVKWHLLISIDFTISTMGFHAVIENSAYWSKTTYHNFPSRQNTKQQSIGRGKCMVRHCQCFVCEFTLTEPLFIFN
jgi:hypothetical protein